MTYSRDRDRFSLFTSNDTSGNPILRTVESIYIDWRYLTREENRSYPVFLSSHPPFEGILFRRGSTNIIRAPSWTFNGSTVCIPERMSISESLLVLQLRRASKINPPIASSKSRVSARIFAICLQNHFIA